MPFKLSSYYALNKVKTNFFTGLAVVFPLVVTLVVVFWLFNTIAGLTNVIFYIFPIPKDLVYKDFSTKTVHWYWSLISLTTSVFLISLLGNFARNYLGKKFFKILDDLLLRVPLLNKVYTTIKQVNDSFSSSNRSSFKQVVLVEYPKENSFSIGFVTSEGTKDMAQKSGEKLVGVFIPTTPNPTSGFLIYVPENKALKLNMSVAEGIRCIISLGSLTQTASSQNTQPNEIKS